MNIAIHTTSKRAEPWDDQLHFAPEWLQRDAPPPTTPRPWIEAPSGEITTDYEFLRERMTLAQATFRLRLIALGIIPSSIDAMINQIADPIEKEKARTAWEYATEIHRLHPLVITMGTALGKTPEQIDQIFTT